MIPGELLEKAKMAAGSAALLLANGDTDGACNRAYYSVFDAARALLLAMVASFELDSIRTHSGLITVFGLQAVKPGVASAELGRILNRLHELRLVADYSGDQVDRRLAQAALRDAQQFIAEVERILAI